MTPAGCQRLKYESLLYFERPHPAIENALVATTLVQNLCQLLDSIAAERVC